MSTSAGSTNTDYNSIDQLLKQVNQRLKQFERSLKKARPRLAPVGGLTRYPRREPIAAPPLRKPPQFARYEARQEIHIPEPGEDLSVQQEPFNKVSFWVDLIQKRTGLDYDGPIEVVPNVDVIEAFWGVIEDGWDERCAHGYTSLITGKHVPASNARGHHTMAIDTGLYTTIANMVIEQTHGSFLVSDHLAGLSVDMYWQVFNGSFTSIIDLYTIEKIEEMMDEMNSEAAGEG